ncbi:MAG: Zn-ribbon domain-containing OB-fold protein [Proteobacteria bacterium]|nr:Zn-ribbon domain-containing OB-fold protein [Pseudomonadota bacterium]
MSGYNKPLPLITQLSKVFYDGCKANKLLYQVCADCGEIIFFPKQTCPNCMGHSLEWKESSGRGRIFTFTVTYDYAPPEFAADTPYALAIVVLEEGFRMTSNIVESDLDAIRCDMPVEVVFDPVTSDITLPKFRLVGRTE